MNISPKLLHIKLVEYKELLVPKNKAVEGPDLLHIAVFTGLVLVKKLHKLICVKELFGNITKESFLNLLVVFIFPEPIV